MAKISRNRMFKMLTGIIMTFAMIVSLFAGIGAIWVNEDTGKAFAGVVDSSNGKYSIPSASGQLGSDTNPFVVLEIVPNENMAQFGFLVGGQEPVNISEIENAEIKATLEDGTHLLPAAVMETYRWLKWEKEGSSYTEFSNRVPYDQPDAELFTEGGNTYHVRDIGSSSENTPLTRSDRGQYTQYGYYVRVEDGTGEYVLDERESAVEGIDPDAYGYYVESEVGQAGLFKPEDLADVEIDHEQIERLTHAKWEDLTEGDDYIYDAVTGDIYVKYTDGSGNYSDTAYNYVGEKQGDYSLEHKVNETNTGDEDYLIGAETVYTVKFWKDRVNGTLYKSVDVIVPEGEARTVQEPDAPSPQLGKQFSYWRLASDENDPPAAYNFTTPVTDDLDLVAVWGEKVFTVTVDPDNGTATYTIPVVEGQTLAESSLTEPSKTGWTFKRWNKVDGGTLVEYDFSQKVLGDFTLKATYTKNKYNVVFDSNGALEVATQQLDYDSQITDPGAPATTGTGRIGYDFDGWRIGSQDGERINFSTYRVPEGGVTLVAAWVIKKFTVTYHMDGGTGIPELSNLTGVDYGTVLNPPTGEFSKEGFTLEGWKLDPNDSAFFTSGIEVTRNLDIYAIWKKNTCTVYFDLNGGKYDDKTTFAPIEINYNTSILDSGLDYPQTKEGPKGLKRDGAGVPQHFKCWKVNGEEFSLNTPITENITLTATWGYEVKFNLGMGPGNEANTPASQIIEPGNKVIKPANPVRDGYVFYGWKIEPGQDRTPYDFNSTVNRDFNLKAMWATEKTVYMTNNTAQTHTTKNTYYVIFRLATKTDFDNKDTVIYRVDGSPVENPTRTQHPYNYYNYAKGSGPDSKHYKFGHTASNENRARVVFHYQEGTRPTAQPNPQTRQNAYYVVDGSVYNNENSFWSARVSDDGKDYWSSNAYRTNGEKTMFYYLTYYTQPCYYDAETGDEVTTAVNSALTNANVYASAAPAASTNKQTVSVNASKAQKDNTTSNIGSIEEIVTYASSVHMNETGWVPNTTGTGAYDGGSFRIPQYVGEKKYTDVSVSPAIEKTIKLGDYNKEELTVDASHFPEYIAVSDEAKPARIGNKNYVRFVIKNKKTAETQYTLVPKKQDGGNYNWVGLSFADNSAVTQAIAERDYTFFEKHLTGMTFEVLTATYTKLEEGTDGYDKLYSSLDARVVDFYAQKLKNTDLFKTEALGLAYNITYDADNKPVRTYETTSYEFVGWYKDKYGVEPFVDNERITSDVTLYAKWIEHRSTMSLTYDITFATGLPEGTVVSNMPGDEYNMVTQINKGAYICAPEKTPVTDGKIFAGWVDRNGNLFDFANTPINEPLTLTASWSPLGTERFSFRFESNITYLTGEHVKDGTWPADLTDVAINGKKINDDNTFSSISISAPELEKIEGSQSDYIFAGWYLDSECHEKFDFNNAQTTLEKFKAAGINSIVLYARWVSKITPPSYTIKFIANEPASANSTATGLDTYLDENNSVEVEHNKTIEIKKKKRTITDTAEIIPVLKGNVENRINNYNVQVITVTPEDLKKEHNRGLIDRANMIVLSQAYDTDLINIWQGTSGANAIPSYRNTVLFSKNAEDYNLTYTSFVQNDLDWDTTEAILAKIAGVSRSNDEVKTCPVLFDYSIYETITSVPVTTANANITKNLNVTLSLSSGSESLAKNNTKSYKSNIYKLYLMTQQASPVTLTNAYIRGKTEEARIAKVSGTDNSGRLSNGSVGTSDDVKDYWNEYTLVPWKVIKKSEYDANPSVALKLVGFENNLEPDNSVLKNRVLVYKTEDKKGIAKDFSTYLFDGFADMEKVFGTGAAASRYTIAGLSYYMLNSASKNDNYTHNLRVLDIEPGSSARTKDYWFWFISRYVPSYTGTTTVRNMSSSEFICNIDDLKSEYDVIYIGADTSITNIDGNDDGDVSGYLPTLTNVTPSAEAKEYRISTNGGSSFNTESLKLVNVVKNTKISTNYYIITDVIDYAGGIMYEVDPAERYESGWIRKTIYNVLSTRNSYTQNTELRLNTDSFNDVSFLNVELVTPTQTNSGTRLRLLTNSSGTSYKDLALPIKIRVEGVEITMPEPVEVNYNNDIRLRKNHNTSSKGVAFTANFSFRSGTEPAGTKYIVTQSTSKTVDFNGQILIPATATLEEVPLVYSHVGKSKDAGDTRAYGFFNTVSTTGSVTSDDNETLATVYSGNDITFKKFKEIAAFLQAGYPIILGKDLFASPDTDDINPSIDTASWMYKLLDELINPVEGNTNVYYWYREDSATQDATFKRALSNKVFHLNVIDAPPEYFDSDNPANSSKDPLDAYVNGHNKRNRTLQYIIKIESETPNGEYRLKMYTDNNADGRYDEETEQLDSITVKDQDGSSRTGVAASMKLQSGHTYLVSRELTDDYTGIIPWKLKVILLNGNTETEKYDEETGMCAISVDTKEPLYVLQITSEYKANTGNQDNLEMAKTNVLFPTDAEIKAAYDKRNKTEISSTNYQSSYFDSITDVGIGKTLDLDKTEWKTRVKQNMSYFHYYTHILKEFDVHFFRISIDKRKNDDTRITLKDISDPNHRNDPIGYTYHLNDAGEYVKDAEPITWSKINMLILGYADCYNDILHEPSLKLVEEFIQSGKTVLFTHDTTSPYARPLDSQSDTVWGYNINRYFRNIVGMDRYGVLMNRGLLSYSNDSDKYTKGIKEQMEEALGTGVDFDDIHLHTASSYKLKYDIPFRPGTTMQLLNGSTASTNNLVTTTKKYSGNHAGTDTRVCAQGLNNRVVNTNLNRLTTSATQNNNGQIVYYPYTIGTDDTVNAYSPKDYYVTDLAKTHSQYYQLNMEDEEIVVWYSLYEAGQSCQNLINDGSNNYYIYNKANITYSGVGHCSEMNETEYKLFVNTMIAAYSSRVRATEPEITNSDKSADATKGKDFIYVDYDATLPDSESTTPVGGDIFLKTKNIGGTDVSYYAKRVSFTLKNFSIIMNKSMTVHYYPVITDKSNGKRVVLYDYPLELETRRIDGTANGAAVDKYTGSWSSSDISSIGTITSGSAEAKADPSFAYKMPSGKKGKTPDELRFDNYAVVAVKKNTDEVISMEEYFVDIPISDSYYSRVLNLPTSIEYYASESDYAANRKTKLYSKDYPGLTEEPDYDRNNFAIDKQNSFEVEIQIVMRYGRDQTKNEPYVGTHAVEFMRRGMFTLD